MATRNVRNVHNSKDDLTPAQRLFCTEYLKDFNGIRSYMFAFKIKNKGTAATNANRLLKNAKVSAIIKAHVNKQTKKADDTVDKILKTLDAIAFQHPKGLFERDGNKVKNVHDMTDEEAAMLGGLSVSTTMFGRSEKVKRNDPLKAIELLMKYKRMLSGDNDNVPVVNITISKK